MCLYGTRYCAKMFRFIFIFAGSTEKISTEVEFCNTSNRSVSRPGIYAFSESTIHKSTTKDDVHVSMNPAKSGYKDATDDVGLIFVCLFVCFFVKFIRIN